MSDVTYHPVRYLVQWLDLVLVLYTGPGYKKCCTVRNGSIQTSFFSKKRTMGYCLGT